METIIFFNISTPYPGGNRIIPPDGMETVTPNGSPLSDPPRGNRIIPPDGMETRPVDSQDQSGKTPRGNRIIPPDGMET